MDGQGCLRWCFMRVRKDGVKKTSWLRTWRAPVRLGLLAVAWKKLRTAMKLPGSDSLDNGLEEINKRLGFRHRRPSGAVGQLLGTTSQMPGKIAVEPTQSVSRSVVYSPAMDGQAESGEVVWFDAPASLSKGVGGENVVVERPLLVVGRSYHVILGLLISSHNSHADQPNWLAIGSGDWEPSGKPCWLRMDRVVELTEDKIRRRGAVLPRRRFEVVANHLRDRYAWS